MAEIKDAYPATEVAARLNDRRPFLDGRSIKECLISGDVEDAAMAAEGLSALRA
tara:strand:+ start:751 stop:912 length:162 start_codon:yes stop_codon:yes gene_type:complete